MKQQVRFQTQKQTNHPWIKYIFGEKVHMVSLWMQSFQLNLASKEDSSEQSSPPGGQFTTERGQAFQSCLHGLTYCDSLWHSNFKKEVDFFNGSFLRALWSYHEQTDLVSLILSKNVNHFWALVSPKSVKETILTNLSSLLYLWKSKNYHFLLRTSLIISKGAYKKGTAVIPFYG